MNPVVAYMRDFPQSRATLCTEPVLAWLAAGGCAHSFDARVQRRLYRRVGTWRGVREIVRRLGWRLEPPRNLREGEPVVACLPDTSVGICGLVGPNGVVVVAASGMVRIAPLRILRVARPIGNVSCRS